MIGDHIRTIEKETFFFIEKEMDQKDYEIHHQTRQFNIKIKGN